MWSDLGRQEIWETLVGSKVVAESTPVVNFSTDPLCLKQEFKSYSRTKYVTQYKRKIYDKKS